MHPYTIMICDDKEAVHESLTAFMNREGIRVVSVYDGEDVLRTFKADEIDLIILDVMLPNMDGMAVCRALRQKSNVPILFLSARSEEFDRIRGLEIGGDDYVTKPFSPREVTIRVKKLLERLSPRQEEEAHKLLQFAELTVDPETMEVFVDGNPVKMSAKEVSLLAYLVRNPRRVLNREQILNAVWGYDYYGETRTVDALVKRIRRKLPTENMHFSIQSIYGVGYRLGEPE